MIYVASPYSHPSDNIRYARFLAARDYTWQLMEAGKVAFSPIVYGRQFSIQYGAPFSADFWKGFNDHVLMASHAIHILQLDGWEDSPGVAHEVSIAREFNIPLLLVAPR